MSVPAALKFTYEDYALLPEDRRYEVIDGEPFLTPAPTPNHQDIVLELVTRLRDFVNAGQLGRVVLSPCDVLLSRHDILQPDIFFVAAGREGIVGDKYVDGAPDLVIEVLSPSTEPRDREGKAKRYAMFGVREMWIIDPGSRTIEVLENSGQGFRPHVTFGGSELVRSTVLPGLDLPAASIFRRA
jgi:Uma2 family endonuclease